MSRCDTCKYDNLPWYDEPCDSCCGAHSGYEPIDTETDEEEGEADAETKV